VAASGRLSARGLAHSNRLDNLLADILLTLPFVTDLAGNVFDLFDTIEVYDDVMHFLNWCLLSAAFGVLLLRVRIGPIAAAGLTLGFGAITAILWEGIEWLTFIRFGTELATAYEDTLLDEHLGLLGSAVAALLVLRAKRRADRRRLLESG
jgi:hypothetical protein